MPIGVIGVLAALALLRLIGLITNLAYFGRLSSELVAPDDTVLGPWTVLLPVAGGLVIGLMARYGSEGVRGHGIPEAMETILVRGSRVQPRLAILKPLSSAISIGSGGPFGPEGPIIVTGGAAGSVLGQCLRVTAAERKTLLVAGAAAGMAGVFGTPVAAALLAVELLLFELKPRSLVPVGVAAAVAMAVRIELADAGLLDPAPLFPVPGVPVLGPLALGGAVVVGVAAGLLAWLVTRAVYGAEGAFARLPVHWAWWPAIGGAVVGVGGLIEPRVLGAGYASIEAGLAGTLGLGALVTLLVVKAVVWSVALGSGTSGGIVAPVLILGIALGGAMSPILPGGSPAIWALLGMAAALAAVMRAPLTAVVLAFELTYEPNALLPLLVAATAAYLTSVMVLRRSVLTEGVARRGVHVTQEYSIDPLEALQVSDVMSTDVLTLEPERPLADLLEVVRTQPPARRQRLYPVVADGAGIVGVLSWSDLVGADGSGDATVADLMRPDVVVARPGERLREVADRMVAERVGALPVVAPDDPAELIGLVTQFNLFQARVRLMEEERTRERILRLRPLPRRDEPPPS